MAVVALLSVLLGGFLYLLFFGLLIAMVFWLVKVFFLTKPKEKIEYKPKSWEDLRNEKEG